MRLKTIELSGFKSFARKTELQFSSAITSIVGPNGSGKSNVAESFRFVLGEQSMKSLRGKKSEDMIWNGSNTTPRAGRASVRLVFDNTDRALNLDFDEVSIERVVHRDGGNEYLLNGSVVRLRDIAELLSQANIGASGHHIISQGEADRVLTASSRERREMIEDALGLTSFLYKREEAGRKLEKTAENMREVEALRRELTPHLKFLGSQVKKIEEAEQLRTTLADTYQEYLKRESTYLRLSRTMLAVEGEVPQREHSELGETIEQLRAVLALKGQNDAGTRELMALETAGRTLTHTKDSLQRELGRIEGEIAAHERIVRDTSATVPLEEARSFALRIEEALEAALSLEGETLRERLTHILTSAKAFIAQITQGRDETRVSTDSLRERKDTLEAELARVIEEEKNTANQVQTLRMAIESEKDANREAERELFSAMARRSELETILARLRSSGDMLAREEEQYKAEVAEGVVLVGRALSEYEAFEVRDANGSILSDNDMFEEPRHKQEERRRALERMKIRLEHIGAGNASEVLKEFQETTERDQFLARELADLELSSQKLHELIDELTRTLEVRFTEGITKINTEFDAFFKIMFGGGSAMLSVVKEKRVRRGVSEDVEVEDDDEEVETQEGIEIAITLPHKRIKGLHMLSGGERALTSIALIFAMSQVNPPPFLILDETDAALDEANSRRYSDMIETLARKSQLILITHNRETMSRAGILYGVTMGSDGVSKLLSVKFEEALAVAK